MGSSLATSGERRPSVNSLSGGKQKRVNPEKAVMKSKS